LVFEQDFENSAVSVFGDWMRFIYRVPVFVSDEYCFSLLEDEDVLQVDVKTLSVKIEAFFELGYSEL
jgi:hypothetical protein